MHVQSVFTSSKHSILDNKPGFNHDCYSCESSTEKWNGREQPKYMLWGITVCELIWRYYVRHKILAWIKILLFFVKVNILFGQNSCVNRHLLALSYSIVIDNIKMTATWLQMTITELQTMYQNHVAHSDCSCLTKTILCEYCSRYSFRFDF